MKQLFFLSICGFFTLFISCKEEGLTVDYDCGTVETTISEVEHIIGSYSSDVFSNSITTNYEEAAIRVEIIEILGAPDCFAWTVIPQTIETIKITSSSSVLSGGIEYTANEELNGLLKLHIADQTYGISEFIQKHIEDPLIFHSDSDRIVFQLKDKPDISIDQAFTITFMFDDSEELIVEVLSFEVSN